MELHQLERTAPRAAKKRLGRGNSSGQGKTAGRGQKGQKARSTIRVGFEGGQTPLFRRIPKFGFKNRTQKTYQLVTLNQLNTLASETINISTLMTHKIIKSKKTPVKVLNNGKINKKIFLEVHHISQAARQAIEAAGGTVKIIHETTETKATEPK